MAANGSDIASWRTGAVSDGSRAQRGENYTSFQGTIARVANAVREDATLARARNSRSGSEIRYINPAIYAESVSEGEMYDIAQRSASAQQDCPEDSNGQVIDAKRSDCNCPAIDLPSARDAWTNADQRSDERSVNRGQNTYRCYSTSFSDTTLFLEPPSTCRSAISSGTIARMERRCRINVGQSDEATKQDQYKQRSFISRVILRDFFMYLRNDATVRPRPIPDGGRVLRISATSLSDSSSNGGQVSSGLDHGRRIAHSEWIRKKHEAAQRKQRAEEVTVKKRQEEEDRMAREKEERSRVEKENFLKWIERKRQQELDRKAVLESELELQECLKKIEEKTAVAKTLYLRQWTHKKGEEQKDRRRDQELRQRKMNEEHATRLERSSRAYEKWREESKNRPKPATQGLLPHQKAKPAYVNPIPWQSIVEINSDEEPRDAFDNNKGNMRVCREMSDGSVINS